MFVKSLKEYAKNEWLWYAHFITQKNKWEAGSDLLEVPKWTKYIIKSEMLVELLKERSGL